MAVAKIVQIIPVPPPKRVTLDLSMQEAVTLLTIADNVGGSLENSRRGDAASIKNALLEIGVKSDNRSLDLSKINGIYFKDY